MSRIRALARWTLSASLASLPLFSTSPARQTADEKPEIVSLLGTPLYSQPDEKGTLHAAQAKWKADPSNLDSLLALAKAQADLWRYREAIRTYSLGMEMAPANAMLYRHRGHRYISTRQFEKAVQDLAKAATLNDRSFDIWYHLGLARYLLGDFTGAAKAYESCLKVVEDARHGDSTQTEDSLVAVADWLYMTYRRGERSADAARLLERIRPGMNVKENTSYYDRLLFYKGLKNEEELLDTSKATDLEIATRGYGVGNWHFYSGRREKAEEIFRRIVSGKYWPAFGYIAAEAELAR